MFKYRIKLNLPNNILNGPIMKAETAVAQQILKDTDQYVPALTGSLAQRSYTDGGQVVYPGPYARYLYYGKLMVDPNTGSSYAPKGGTKVLTDKDLVFNKTMHGNAQAHWFEVSKAQNNDRWVRLAEKVVRDELKK